MKYTPRPKRDPIKNYFQLPNEIFLLGLSPGALAVYSYLLCCENRKTYQCWPSYKTIGKAVRMSANTVHKYVCELEERQYREHIRHHQGWPEARRQSALHHPSDSAGAGPVLRTAVGADGCGG